ncbi:MAG: penicillin acylase family protein [Chlorobi bacterium]|nr:penicillin acylase family protein [Chlorobiota bacterium]
MRRFSFVGTMLVVVGLVVGFVLLGIRLIGRSFAPDGETEDTVAGLSATASITRNRYGVPYINAATENDAWAALGYAHAQDRLWQMDLFRRAGQGRLSEIFGKKMIGQDALLKTLGFKRSAAATLQGLPKETRAAIDAYCRGVNAWITSHAGRYPFEFDALGYTPEPWQPEHTVIITKLLAWELNTSFWTDMVFADIKERVDSARFAEILPWYPSDAPTIIPGGQKPEPLLEQYHLPPPPDTARRDSIRRDSVKTPVATTPPISDLLEVMELDAETKRSLGIEGAHVGSNAWAVAGNRAANGKPVLANDPHLAHSAPGKWYQAVVAWKGTTIAGVTVPGCPFVVIGRNNSVAWGLTSMMADQTDFFIEQLDSTKRRSYLLDGAWKKLTIIRDTIHCKDSAATPMVIRATGNGPLLSDVRQFRRYLRDPHIGFPQMVDSASPFYSHAVSLRWVGQDPSTELAGWQAMNRAKNLAEFTKGARMCGVPALSFVYADAAGNIAYIPAAKLPQRGDVRWNLPNPGTESRFAWKGYIPSDQLPVVTNPASGYIASANNKVSNTTTVKIGDLWEDPSRAFRLNELLKDGANFDAQDMAQIQNDVRSPHLQLMTEFLLRAFPDSLRQTPLVRGVLARLRHWDGGMLIDAPEPAIVAAWFQTVVEMTYADELGPQLYRQFGRMALLPIRSLRYHLLRNSQWFDNVATSQNETRDQVLRAALGRALDTLHRRFGSWEIGTWRYGSLHTLTFHHPFGQNPQLRGIVDIGPFELGGANTTLNNGEWRLDLPYEVTLGPSMRQIVDFADTTAFLRSVLPTGQSGQPLSEFYSNQTILYLSNGYLLLQQHAPEGASALSVVELHPD